LNYKAKTLTTMICTALLTPVCAFALSDNQASAVTAADLNADEVFVKQHTSYTCTLSSNTMLLRRAAMLKGMDWQSITEESCRNSFWIEGTGMPFSYTYQGIHVESQRIYGSSAETLRQMLKEHPEGVVAYDYDHPHAILLTDYTDGVFYCADPANCVPNGRVDASYALIDVNGIEDCWYVTDSLPNPTDKEVINNSTINSVNITVGAKIVLTGSAEGGEGTIKYSFFYKKSTDGSWTSINSKSSKAEFTPASCGKYDFKVVASDNSGLSVEKVFTVQVNKKPELSLTIPGTIEFGKDVVIKAQASGGTGNYQYEINAVKPSGASVNIRKYCSLSELKYHPYELGDYKITVNVKDSCGIVATKTVVMKVISGELNNLSTTGSDRIYYGEDIMLNASASGGAGNYEYKYVLDKPCGVEVTLKNFSKTSSIKYHPYEVGTYTLKIIAKDGLGKVKTKEMTFNVESVPLKNYSTVSSLSIKYGETITFTGNAIGGTGGYQYRIDAQKPCGDKVTIINYTPYKTYIYRPWERGTYTFRTFVKDKDGAVSTRLVKVNVY